MAVIGVLISLMLPSVKMVRESARRVVCGSNLRQAGLAIHMYSEDWADYLPPSVFMPQPNHARDGGAGEEGSPELMDIVRTDPTTHAPRAWGQWDGLGLLFHGDYLPAPAVYYCPSHTGTHPAALYEDAWRADDGEIVTNYLFRGSGPEGRRRLYQIRSEAAIVSDTLRSYEDLNHEGGFNILQAGLSVAWVDDVGNSISDILLRGGNDEGNGTSVQQAWHRLDGARPQDD